MGRKKSDSAESREEKLGKAAPNLQSEFPKKGDGPRSNGTHPKSGQPPSRQLLDGRAEGEPGGGKPLAGEHARSTRHIEEDAGPAINQFNSRS